MNYSELHSRLKINFNVCKPKLFFFKGDSLVKGISIIFRKKMHWFQAIV